MRKPANIFLLAIIVGALSAAMIYRHLKSMNLEVEAAKAAGQHPVTDVVVARDTISIGTRVTPDALKIVTWPAEAQPEGSVHDPQELAGNIARTTIAKNQPDEKPVEVPTVTLLVSPEQAETLTLATRYDAVRLALRNYRDEDMVQTQGMTAAAMFQDRPAGPAVMEAKDTSAGCTPSGPTVEV